MKDRIRKILREENDFDWISKPQKANENQITSALTPLLDDGVNRDTIKSLVNLISDFEITEGQVETLGELMKMVAFGVREYTFYRGVQAGWESGHSEGYNEGFSEGEHEGYNDCVDRLDDARYEGYEEGKEDGYEKGYRKGYRKASEEIYNIAFEEGRQYQSDLEAEEYERRQDPFTRFDDEDEY